MSAPERLVAYQRALLAAVRETAGSEAPSRSGVEAWLREGPPPVATGLGIYRRGYRATVERTAEGLFPSVAAAVGERDFARLVARYVTDRPSREPSLARFGEGFPEWLLRASGSPEAERLHDLARLDRAWFRVRFDSGASPARAPGLPRRVHPSYLIDSRHDLLASWTAGGRREERAAEAAGPSRLLVWRTRSGELRVDRVEESAATILEAAGAEDPEALLAAIDRAVETRGEKAVADEVAELTRRGWLEADAAS